MIFKPLFNKVTLEVFFYMLQRLSQCLKNISIIFKVIVKTLIEIAHI